MADEKPVNLLAINIGNTRTQLGTFASGQLENTEVFSNSNPDIAEYLKRAYEPIRDSADAIVVLASTCQDQAGLVSGAVNSVLDMGVVRIEEDVVVPIGRQLDPEAIVGQDRLLNAAAAFDVMRQACVVVDAGTAVTVDFVDGVGTFHGGAIVCGARMMLDALGKNAAQLPMVELEKPSELIGHSTVEAMRCGVFYGIRGIVRELVEQYAEVAGTFPVVVATGGDGEFLFGDYQLVDRVVPDLTLLGMKLALAGPKKSNLDVDREES